MLAASTSYAAIDSKTPRKSSNLYRQYFTPVELRLLEATSDDLASSELNLLRVLLARTLAAARQRPRLGLKDRGALLTTFSNATVVIASIVRFYDKVTGGADALGAGLLQAIDELDPNDL